MIDGLFLLGTAVLALVSGARIATRVYATRTPVLAGTAVSTTTGCATTGSAGHPTTNPQ